MPSTNNINTQIFNMLVSRDFHVKLLDQRGQEIMDPQEATMFSFDLEFEDRNYGTVVVLLTQDSEVEVYFGDNIGSGMDEQDRDQWYKFLQDVRMMTKRNLMKFNVNNINRLKYTMQGLAAIKEGLFEGWQPINRRNTMLEQPQQVRIIVRHNQDMPKDHPRHGHIESLWIENAQGERFRLPFRSLMGAKMMGRHCAEGGNPYDPMGVNIGNMVTEMNTLSRFLKAVKNRQFDEGAAEIIQAADLHYGELKRKAKRMIGRRGYQEAVAGFDPSQITETEKVVDEIRDMFIERRLDDRIDEALPLIKRIMDDAQGKMKELSEFESWAQRVTEGTWALPETPEQQASLQKLMRDVLPVGPDASNATEQLYDLVGDDELFDIIGDMARKDPDANVWDDPRVQQRLTQLGIDVDQLAQPAQQPQAPQQPV